MGQACPIPPRQFIISGQADGRLQPRKASVWRLVSAAARGWPDAWHSADHYGVMHHGSLVLG
jgi:hypothetical protein